MGPRYLVAYLCDFGMEVRISIEAVPGVVVECEKDAEAVHLTAKDAGALSKREADRLRAVARAASAAAPAAAADGEGESGSGNGAAAAAVKGLTLPAVIRPLDIVPVLLKVRGR